MFVEVIVDILNSEVDRIFDYEISTPAKVGTRVLVPFGKRNIEGYVLKTKEKSILDKSKIKSVISADERPVLLPEMIQLIDFMTQNFNIRKMRPLSSTKRKNNLLELEINERYSKMNHQRSNLKINKDDFFQDIIKGEIKYYKNKCIRKK